ncbi:Peptidyl-prolyl cis-trans isomerase SurA [Salinivirga cyanobacteriivorans]|uniref:Periplasmic chaperone PpiD n=1 Tax=Salinivirga cyanobacteriivorans TaxID=1307839 RepID=A0A0S2HYL4_9BACT|nr:SurA N-terminal domain-containing protein [Salinivirga cyanobacteriivorans]ALO15187.1 Peptidyl-prolyl cis-trans isomerase SurA [Salinivirga cyanobacteriivorans]
MATLEKIRNRMGLLVSIVIGMALLAFILGDLFRGGTNLTSDQFELAEINGVSVDYRNYQQRLEDALENAKTNSGQSTLDDQTRYQVRDQVWEQLLQERIMGEEFDEAGVNVSTEELKDMVVGNNIHPQIRQAQAFQNPQTGQFDPERVKMYIAQLQNDPEARSRWMAFEQSLKQQRLNNKYYAAIQKGMYVTDSYAKQAAIEQQKKVDFKYVSIPYTDLKDEDVTISDADLKEYYEAHKKMFKQEEALDMEYISFSIEPSPEDIQAIKSEVESLIPELKDSEVEAQFVAATSDEPFDPKYYKKGEHENATLDSIMFTQEEGDIYGPYREDGYFKVAKLAHVDERPDTVKVRHIVLMPTEQRGAQQTQALADSLTKELESGADFATLAEEFSADQETAKKGGELGWRKVEEIIYSEALLDAGVNEVVQFPTNQYIFIAKMDEVGKEVKQAQLAVISREIVPSEDTRDRVYQKASKFAAQHNSFEEFNTGIEQQGLVKKQANNLNPTSREIAGLENARNIIREAFFTEENQIIVDRNSQSPIFELGDNYVLGVVTEKYEEGFAPLEDVRATVERAVRKEKKAQMLMDKMNDALANSSNIEALGSALSVDVKMSEGVSFGAFSVPGLGIEPKVQGVAQALNQDEISSPIEGNNAVYVIQVTDIQEPGDNLNIAMQKQSIQRNYLTRVQREVFEVLKENAEIDDKRINFY